MTTLGKLENLSTDLHLLVDDLVNEQVKTHKRIEELEDELTRLHWVANDAHRALAEAYRIIKQLEQDLVSQAGRSIKPIETSLHGN